MRLPGAAGAARTVPRWILQHPFIRSPTLVSYPQLPFQASLVLSASCQLPYTQFAFILRSSHSRSLPLSKAPPHHSPPHPQSFRRSRIRSQSPLILDLPHISPRCTAPPILSPVHPQPPSQSLHPQAFISSKAPLTLSLPHAPLSLFSPLILSQFSSSSSVSSILSLPHCLLSLLSAPKSSLILHPPSLPSYPQWPCPSPSPFP